MRTSVPSCLTLAAISLFPALAGAQTVRGELVERGSGQPIRAAMVLLLDSAGARRVAALTDSAGRFELRAPAAGTYRLRAERVGFRSTVSPPLALGAGQVRAYRMEGDPVAVSLAEVRVRGARRCRVRPGAGQATAVLWEEARKALSAAAHADQAGLLRFDVELYGRDLEPGTEKVLKDEREQRSGQAHAPFRAASVDSLSRFGFVRSEGDSLVFNAPDAGVLLSDRFLADHCFRVQEDAEHPGLMGLAFEPVPARRDVSEVTGVLWLDRRTAELRWLEYSYV
ncbi:MAG TPA: carboxypeptidase-like regulatory domain-containing protein, partial [Longimicrobiaceae bacterium]|nr:carboxypeptidase-like regulatory domain-containing protein [Longimicrobiaceae bacterium]